VRSAGVSRRIIRLLRGSLAFLCLGEFAAIRAVEISTAEASAPPTRERIDALLAEAATAGWESMATSAREAARLAYAEDRTVATSAWFGVQRWAEIWGQRQRDFVVAWANEVATARVAHPNMPREIQLNDRRLGEAVPADLKRWLLGEDNFTRTFIAQLDPVDYLPNVLATLARIWESDGARFRAYPELALAIALVYDVPPPPDWPHGQGPAGVIGRGWPDAAEAFIWWVREDQAGRTYHRLNRLGVEELKFVVDASAPFAELQWSQETVTLPLAEFAEAYPMVRYRPERLQANLLRWPGSTYRLADILEVGGICVDQAYFATQAGKARGIPTLLFRGEGLDGRHAWFGFFDEKQNWQLDAGRYAEQRFITGLAYDPQTWKILTDHELQFLAEGFRRLPSWGQSIVHAAMAEEMLAGGEAAAAVVSARKAVNYERRNGAAWETLLRAQAADGASAATLEGILREAARGFARYPDLEQEYTNRLIASLRERGQTSQADFTERQMIQKYQASRTDLSIQQAGEQLRRGFDSLSVRDQVRAYQNVVNTQGRGAGIEFFDEVVIVFAEHLWQLGDRTAAADAVDFARTRLRVPAGSQLEGEINALAQRIRR